MKRRLNIDLVAFIDRFCRRNERNESWQLSPHQRAVIGLMFLTYYAIRLWSEPKKSGKTFLAALIALYYALTRPDSEIVCLANDQEQAESRVFVTAVKLCQYNAELGVSARIVASEIRFANGSTVRAASSDYKGAAGGRQLLTIFNELWAYDSERAARLFEEMTPPPLAVYSHWTKGEKSHSHANLANRIFSAEEETMPQAQEEIH